MVTTINNFLESPSIMNKTQSHFWFSCLIVVSTSALLGARVLGQEVGAVIISTIIGSYIGANEKPKS